MLTRGRSLVLVCVWLAATAAILVSRAPAANPNDRTISFYHIHTKETLTVTYKSNGEFIPSALKKLNWILRDWRSDQSIEMDPRTIDLAWEMHNELGSTEPIHIISGYRSPKTNAMLRKTRGGQAKKSQHMVGKAIDISFPDVSVKKMRYSALIRERGGVGYYPTSGIPFVHIDTGRVRAWPRLPRYELALLFPSGKTRHQAAEGGGISKADVTRAKEKAKAQSKAREVAIQIAQFHADRKNPQARVTRLATLRMPKLVARPEQASRPAGDDNKIERKPFVVASLSPGPAAAELPWLNRGQADTAETTKPKPASRSRKAETSASPSPTAQREPPARLTLASTGAQADAPKLVRAPKLIERSSRFSLKPSETDRQRLSALIKTASLTPTLPRLPSASLTQSPRETSAGNPQASPQDGLAAAASLPSVSSGVAATPARPDEGPLGAMANLGARLATLSPDFSAIGVTDLTPGELGNGWAQAPEFDEDHPDELAYRPFPLAPLLTETASAHAPELSQLVHHDVAATLDMIDDVGEAAPMMFRPGRQVAKLLWAQKFQGGAINLEALGDPAAATANGAGSAIARRAVALTTDTALNP